MFSTVVSKAQSHLQSGGNYKMLMLEFAFWVVGVDTTIQFSVGAIGEVLKGYKQRKNSKYLTLCLQMDFLIFI